MCVFFFGVGGLSWCGCRVSGVWGFLGFRSSCFEGVVGIRASGCSGGEPEMCLRPGAWGSGLRG